MELENKPRKSSDPDRVKNGEQEWKARVESNKKERDVLERRARRVGEAEGRHALQECVKEEETQARSPRVRERVGRLRT